MDKNMNWLDLYADAYDDEEMNAQTRKAIEERDLRRENERKAERRQKRCRWLAKQGKAVFWVVFSALVSALVGVLFHQLGFL